MGLEAYKYALLALWRDLKKLSFLVAPLAIGLFPILSLYERNIQDVLPNLIVQPILVVIIVTILSSVLLLIFKVKTTKIGVILSLAWVFFFFYVPFVNLAAKYHEPVRDLDSILLPIWSLIFLGISWLILKSKQSQGGSLNFLTAAGLTVVAVQFFGIVNHTVQAKETDLFKYLVNEEYATLSEANRKRLPDIYYIILDGYPRSDTLMEYFDYDNNEFDGFLESNGFVVFDDSYTNYSQTALAIPSILNMSYIKDLPEEGGIPLEEMMGLYHNNKVLHFLKSAGYKWVNNTNYYRAGNNNYADLNIQCNSSNEFLKELINTTMLMPLELISNQQRQDLRADGLCVIDEFDHTLAGPTLTFSHIISPHPPYVYGRNGEDVSEVNLSLNDANRWLAKEPFIDQLIYLNKRLEETVKSILNKSPESIIIIQSDHGTLSSATEAKNLADKRPVVLKERHRNYLAMHLPDWCSGEEIDHTISGVNTFRIVFNNCFATDFEILDDTIYYNSSAPRGYRNFEDITDVISE